MSKKQAIAFFEEISKNNKLAQEVEKVVGVKGSDTAKAKELISLAQKYNFHFTPEEAAGVQGELKKPLSPEEMLEVSGGKLNLKSSLLALTLLAGLGVGGTISNMDTNAIGPEKTVQGQSEQGGVDNDDSAEEARRMEEEGQQVAQHTRERDHVNINGTAQGANLSIFRSANPLSFTVYDGYQPRLNNRFGEAAGNRGQRMEERNIHTMQPGQAPADNSNNAMNALYQQKRTQPQFQRNFNFNSQQMGSAGGLGLKFNPSFSAMPAPALRVTPALDLEQQREKHLQKLERKQQRNREGDKPTLPIDRTERRADVERQEGRPRRGDGWKIGKALLHANLNDLLQKYRTSASAGSDLEWINSVARAVANGVRPDLTTTLTTAPRAGFQETCAFCGRSGCVDVGDRHPNGRMKLRCTNAGCPLNWVAKRRYREVTDSTTSVAPHKYEVERWGQLPKLIAEIDGLVARTKYDNHGNAVRLRDSTDSERRAMGELLRQLEAEERQREESRQQAREALQREEQLSAEQKESIAKLAAQAGLVTCRAKRAPGGKGCGSRKVHLNARPRRDNIQFKCNDCGKTFSYQHADLLAMLQKGQAVAPPAAETGHQPQMLQRMQSTLQEQYNEQPVIAEENMQLIDEVTPAENQTRPNASLSAPSPSSFETFSTVKGGKRNKSQQQSQMRMQQSLHQNWNEMDFDDDDDYDYYGRDCYDREGNPRQLREEKPSEEKERREDYENPEPYVPEPGMMGYQDPSTPMMNQHDFSFNFGSRNLNPFNYMRQNQRNGQNIFTSDFNQGMDEIIDVDAFDNDEENMQMMNEVIDVDALDNDSAAFTRENMQMTNDVAPADNQPRHNAERHFEMEMEIETNEDSDEIKEQRKDYENQKPNQNIPQLPHLQPHRSMILENTNETFTPFATANLDAISDALADEISKDKPDVNYIKGLLQRARELQNPGHSVNGFTTFNDLIDFALDVANDFGRDDIHKLIVEQLEKRDRK